MMSRMYQMARKVRDWDTWRGLVSTVADGLGQTKDILDELVIKNRQYKNRDILHAMHLSVLQTPSLKCNPDAPVEIHTLTAHHHLSMYVTAIKSFLRYYDNVAVVVHDDGSLDAQDKALLKQQVWGLKVIDKQLADKKMSEAMVGFPHSFRLRERIVNSMELFDNILLSKTERVVNMNSDVLFFREPTEVIDWITHDDQTIAGVYEETPAEQRGFLRRQGCPFPPHVTTALTCFHRGICELQFIENALASVRPDWFTAQNVYPLLFDNKKTEHRARFFDKSGYQASGIFANGATFRHYWTSTGRFTDLQYEDSRRVISELSAKHS